MSQDLRTSAGSHKRFLVIEVFGRYSGFTAMLPTMVGAFDRCVIPESSFDVEHLTELLIHDRKKNYSKYASVLVSEGATMKGLDEMLFEDREKDMFGHAKLGGIGDVVSTKLKELSPKYNQGERINTINQKLGYLVRCGDADWFDLVVGAAYANIAFDLIISKNFGRMTSLWNGCYTNAPIDVVVSSKKLVDIDNFYSIEHLRPKFKALEGQQLLILSSNLSREE
jgi:6-phosphofructokinase 1